MSSWEAFGGGLADIWSAVVSDIPSTLNTAIILIMLLVFLNDRRRSRNEGTSNFQSSMQIFNQAVLNDDEFIKYDCQLHPFGDLSEQEIKKVYFWFLAFNISYAAAQASKHKSMRSKLAKSSLTNIANLSFGDRNFIEKHVFTRGYDNEFVLGFKKQWREIDKNNRTLPMVGAPKDSGVEPRRNVVFKLGGEQDFYAEVEEDPETLETEKEIALSNKSGMVDAPVSNLATKEGSPISSSKS